MDDAFQNIELIQQQLDSISAQLQQLLAIQKLKPASPISPFIPAEEAAKLLHYANPDQLKEEIRQGKIPTQFVRWKTGPKGERRRYLLNVDGYISHLLGKGRR
jgi:hypothetical protein